MGLRILLSVSVLACSCSSEPTHLVAADPDAGGDVLQDREQLLPQDASEDTFDAQEDAIPDAVSNSPVCVALLPNPASKEGGPSKGAAEMHAYMDALAAGAKGLTLAKNWSALSSTGQDSVQSQWDSLRTFADIGHTQRRQLFLSINMVRGATDLRPAQLNTIAWDDEQTLNAMRSLVDSIYDTFSDELAFLSFGAEVDLYLDAYNKPFVTALDQHLTYATSHPRKPPLTQVSVSWTGTGLLENTLSAQAQQLIDAAPVVMLSYYPIDTAGKAKPPAQTASEIAAIIDTIKDKTIVLNEVAYPSSSLISGGDSAQAEFIKVLFSTIASRRARVPFVSISMLHDPAPDECLDFAASRLSPGSPELYAFWCSIGLRERNETQKSSFEAFMASAAVFLDP